MATKRQKQIVEHFIKTEAKKALREASLSREHTTATNRIDSVVELIFKKYKLNSTTIGANELEGKRILNGVTSEIADAIMNNSEIIKLIKAG